jgi:hypothetical protein
MIEANADDDLALLVEALDHRATAGLDRVLGCIRGANGPDGAQ